MQTSANAKIWNKSDSGFEFGLICIRMSVLYVPKLWMHYLIGVSHFAKYGTNRLLIVWELRKQRNANKCPKIAYSSVKKTSIALLSQRGRSIASIVKYLQHSFFYIINYFGFIFTSAYNSILFCYLRRNVEPCCHSHDSRSCIVRDSAWSVSHCSCRLTSRARRLVVQYPH